MTKNTKTAIIVFIGSFFLPLNLLAIENIQLGVRPYYLVSTMSESKIKNELLACRNKTNKRSTF